MGTLVLKIAFILVALGGAAWGLQKLFPPTEQDVARSEADYQRKLERFQAASREAEEKAARESAAKAAKAANKAAKRDRA